VNHDAAGEGRQRLWLVRYQLAPTHPLARRQGGREEPRRGQPRRDEPLREREKPAPVPGVGNADPVRLHDAERGKDLRVRVTWPEQPGPFPVIVFSHRVGGARHDYRPLVEHWANGGYVVIQVDHSDSRELTPSGPGLDWIEDLAGTYAGLIQKAQGCIRHASNR
jgi:hypothetical protein